MQGTKPEQTSALRSQIYAHQQQHPPALLPAPGPACPLRPPVPRFTRHKYGSTASGANYGKDEHQPRQWPCLGRTSGRTHACVRGHALWQQHRQQQHNSGCFDDRMRPNGRKLLDHPAVCDAITYALDQGSPAGQAVDRTVEG